MAKRKGCDRTLDLLNWQPPQLVRRFEEQRVRAATLRARIARAVSETLKDCVQTRAAVAAAMSEWLGEEITVNMLNAYASEAREDHTIPFLRLLALVHATDDVRLLQIGAELFDHAVIEGRFLRWVEVGQMADKKDEFDRAFDAARRQARRGSRS